MTGRTHDYTKIALAGLQNVVLQILSTSGKAGANTR